MRMRQKIEAYMNCLCARQKIEAYMNCLCAKQKIEAYMNCLCARQKIEAYINCLCARLSPHNNEKLKPVACYLCILNRQITATEMLQ